MKLANYPGPYSPQRKSRLGPLLDTLEAPHILEYPLTPKFWAVRQKIEPEQEYTLSECATLTGVDRTVLMYLVRPTTCDKLRFAPVSPTKPGQPLRITGTTLLTILDALDQFPEPYITSAQLADVLGRTHNGLVQSIVTVEGRRALPYLATSGKRMYIPGYTAPGVNEKIFDARIVPFLKKEQEQKQRTLSWEDAVGFFISQNIDVQAAQLFTLVPYFDREARVFTYPLLDGTEVKFKSIDSNKDGEKRGIRFSKENIRKLAKQVKIEQTAWMTATEFADILEQKLGTRSSSCPFTFTLDGKEHAFGTVTRGNFAYIRRAVAHGYIEWRKLRESKEHVLTNMCYRGITPEQTEKRRIAFEDARELVAERSAIVVAPSTGIAIPVRECSKTEKVRPEGKELIGFYLTLKTANERTVQAALGRLGREIGEEPVRIEAILGLWILRDHWMQGSKRATPGYVDIDRFFSTQESIGKRARELMSIGLDEVPEYCREKGKEILIYTPRTDTIDEGRFYETVLAADDKTIF